MAKARSPNRDKALEIFIQHNGDITNRRIAELLDEKEKTISNWKSRDAWNVVLQTGERSTTKRRESTGGAPKGNKNAVGNEGGAPKGNSNAVTHGFFRKFLPDETAEIIEQLEHRSPIDMLWDQIMIQYTAIIRAQRIMYVRDQEDMTKELKKDMDIGTEYDIQYAWDKQATFLQAQSRAMGELRSLIKQYEEMCRLGDVDEKRQLEISKLKAEVTALNKDTVPDAVIFEDGVYE